MRIRIRSLIFTMMRIRIQISTLMLMRIRNIVNEALQLLIYSLPAAGVHVHPGADWEDEGAEPSTHGEEQRWRWSRRQQNHPADRRSQGIP